MKDLILHILRGINAIVRVVLSIWHRSAVHGKEKQNIDSTDKHDNEDHAEGDLK